MYYQDNYPLHLCLHQRHRLAVLPRSTLCPTFPRLLFCATSFFVINQIVIALYADWIHRVSTITTMPPQVKSKAQKAAAAQAGSRAG